MRSVFFDNTTFYQALSLLASAQIIENGRFPARNFLLESQLPRSRVDEYTSRLGLPTAGGNAQASLSAFSGFHNAYVEDELRRGVRSNDFDPASLDCPHTFRAGCSLDEFGGSDEDLLLIRVEDVSAIARQTAEAESDVYTLLEDVARERRSSSRGGTSRQTSKQAACDQLLRRWQDSIDNRPLFSAFWDDAKSLLDDPRAGWAEELRDRLGLVHYDASIRRPGSGIAVVLFRYPVKLVPRSAIRVGSRFMVRPTVLDGPLNEAFFTAPPDGGVGCTVDLMVRDDDPWQEIVHPAVEFRAQHVWATDTIHSGLKSELGDARGHHCLKLCVRSSEEFVESCQATGGLL